jgi:hypothetical protein
VFEQGVRMVFDNVIMWVNVLSINTRTSCVFAARSIETQNFHIHWYTSTVDREVLHVPMLAEGRYKALYLQFTSFGPYNLSTKFMDGEFFMNMVSF